MKAIVYLVLSSHIKEKATFPYFTGEKLTYFTDKHMLYNHYNSQVNPGLSKPSLLLPSFPLSFPPFLCELFQTFKIENIRNTQLSGIQLKN